MSKNYYYVDGGVSAGQSTLTSIKNEASTFGIGATTNLEAETVIASGGFISIGNTTPIQITLDGSTLTFNAVGIGSASLTLS